MIYIQCACHFEANRSPQECLGKGNGFCCEKKLFSKKKNKYFVQLPVGKK